MSDRLTRDAPPLVAATRAIAALRRVGEHSNACPVVRQGAAITECSCWIIRDARRDAEVALDAARATPHDAGCYGPGDPAACALHECKCRCHAARATPDLIEAVKLLNSMVESGERHSDHSRAIVRAALAAANPTRRKPVTLADSEDYGDDASDWFAAPVRERDPSNGYHDAFHEEHGDWCRPCPFEEPS